MQLDSQTATINPAFAGHAAKYIRDVSDDLQRVFDNLLEIANGDVPDANGYDRLRATRILYDRGFGKVNKNTPQAPPPAQKPVLSNAEGPILSNSEGSNQQTEPEEPLESEISDSHDDHSSDNRANLNLDDAPPGTISYIVSLSEQKLDDLLGPVQPAEQPKLRTPLEMAEGFVPDIVRDSQYYVLEITDYGAKLADILMSIHEPDPDDDTIRQCHRVTAGQMMIDRVLGPAVSLQYDLDNTYDPAEDPYWALRHPSEIDSNLTTEELKEVDRETREFVESMKKEDEGPCEDCEDGYLCEIHDPESEYYDDGNISEEEIEILARGMRTLELFGDRLQFDPADGRLKLTPPPIDYS